MSKDRVGLIAGGGELPLEFLKSAKQNNFTTVTFAIVGITDQSVSELSDETVWIKPFKLGKLLKEIKRSGVTEVTFLGKVEHRVAFSLKSLDLKSVKLLTLLKDRRPESLIKAIFKEVEKLNVRIISPEKFLKHLLLPKGTFFGKAPNEELLSEMKWGVEIAKKISSLDIGQTVIVKNRTVIAVEGVEGTDECIRRGALLAGRGFLVCKAARKDQDMRIDVPTVGEKTVELVKSLGGKGIAVEGERTYVVTPSKVKKLCETYGITFAAV